MKTGLSNVGGEAGVAGRHEGVGGWECADLPRIPIGGRNKTFSRGVITRV